MSRKTTTTKGIKIIVKPATDNAYRERFAKANGKVIPFDVPIIVEERDIRVLQRMKEPKKAIEERVDVHKIMNQMQISQEKANRIARTGERDMNNNGVSFVPKYFVQIV